MAGKIVIEDARLVCKNFAGKKTDFNDEGKRNFGVLLPDDMAEDMEADGWSVKRFNPRPNADDPDYRQPWLKVNVSYKSSSPVVILITRKGKIKLTEETIDQLDWTNMQKVDLIITPYNYKATKTHPAGISAYLKSIYVTVREDVLEEKYSDLPWADANDEEVFDDVEEVPFF